MPHLVLTEERLQYVKKDCLLVDLASNPGGIDKRAAKDKNLKLIWALALPGKVAPVTTAEFIKDTVTQIADAVTELKDEKNERNFTSINFRNRTRTNRIITNIKLSTFKLNTMGF